MKNSRKPLLLLFLVLLFLSPILFNVLFDNLFMFEWGLLLVISISIVIIHPSYKKSMLVIVIFAMIKIITEISFNRIHLYEIAYISLIGTTITHSAVILLITNFRIKNCKLEEELNRLLKTDELTGVYNRRYFNEYFHRLGNNNHSFPLQLFIVDIDYFKKVNDNYGHQMGDEVLKRVANVIVDEISGYGTIARLGGEEFAIVLPKIHQDEGLELVERIRKTICNTKMVFSDSAICVTLSFGGSEMLQGDTVGEVFSKADEALYVAKNSGRNKVVFNKNIILECSNDKMAK